MTARVPVRRRPLVTVALALTMAACGSSAMSSHATPGGTPGGAQPLEPTPVPMPTVPATAGDGGSQPGGDRPGGGGGAVPGNPGDQGGGSGGGPGDIPDDSQATIVAPVANLMNVHDVGAASLRAAVDGRHVMVKLAWWSGVEPCSAFAGVDIARDGSTISLAVREGSAANGVACIDIAMFKATVVDLGDLDPGTYTIRASGDAPPVEIAVSD
jgi:hypothetical protein